MRAFTYFVKNPLAIVAGLVRKVSALLKDDALFLRIIFFCEMGRKLNLDSPETLSEKLQWLKINDRNPLYPLLVDKIAVKQYVSDLIGSEYIIETYKTWDKCDDIAIDSLPDQFVLKTNNGSGGSGVVVCRNKCDLDISQAKKKLYKSFSEKVFMKYREWPYSQIEPKYFAERYISDLADDLPDYKIHCFNGVPKFILVCKDRYSSKGLSEDFFDISWNHLAVQRPSHKNSEIDIPQPGNLCKMLELASLLAKNLPFVRVDFYSINNKIYFGELTLYPASGLVKFVPESFDLQFGKLLDISHVTRY